MLTQDQIKEIKAFFNRNENIKNIVIQELLLYGFQDHLYSHILDIFFEKSEINKVLNDEKFQNDRMNLWLQDHSIESRNYLINYFKQRDINIKDISNLFFNKRYDVIELLNSLNKLPITSNLESQTIYSIPDQNINFGHRQESTKIIYNILNASLVSSKEIFELLESQNYNIALPIIILSCKIVTVALIGDKSDKEAYKNAQNLILSFKDILDKDGFCILYTMLSDLSLLLEEYDDVKTYCKYGLELARLTDNHEIKCQLYANLIKSKIIKSFQGMGCDEVKDLLLAHIVESYQKNLDSQFIDSVIDFIDLDPRNLHMMSTGYHLDSVVEDFYASYRDI